MPRNLFFKAEGNQDGGRLFKHIRNAMRKTWNTNRWTLRIKRKCLRNSFAFPSLIFYLLYCRAEKRFFLSIHRQAVEWMVEWGAKEIWMFSLFLFGGQWDEHIREDSRKAFCTHTKREDSQYIFIDPHFFQFSLDFFLYFKRVSFRFGFASYGPLLLPPHSVLNPLNLPSSVKGVLGRMKAFWMITVEFFFQIIQAEFISIMLNEKDFFLWASFFSSSLLWSKRKSESAFPLSYFRNRFYSHHLPK